MNTTTDANRKRKVLVPLATLVVAGAVAVGSGASFTSQSTSNASVTAGTLHHTNNKDTATLTVDNMKPGDVRTGTLTITNDGSLDSTLSLTETASTNGFATDALLLKIENGTSVVYNGNFGGLGDTEVKDLGALNKGASATITFTVTMAAAADNANQGKTATANFQWVTTQLAGDTGLAGWL